jgi:putative modified peptide
MSVSGNLSLEIALDSDQAQAVLNQLLADQTFREDFDSDPEAALAQFGITGVQLSAQGDTSKVLPQVDVAELMRVIQYPSEDPPAFVACSRIALLAYLAAAAGTPGATP